MSKLLEPAITLATGAEERTVLDGISWRSYESLLQDYADPPRQVRAQPSEPFPFRRYNCGSQ